MTSFLWFADGALAPLARRTERLDHIVHHLGLALGGRPAAAFATRLMTPVSNDTLLRVVRRRAGPPADRLAVIGIDDFAWRRNHRYGTIVCDLERRRTVALLADREQPTAEDWLRGHPGIAIVAADMARPSPSRFPTPSRSPIAGISCTTPPRRSSTPYASR